jgi:hypothetical protein
MCNYQIIFNRYWTKDILIIYNAPGDIQGHSPKQNFMKVFFIIKTGLMSEKRSACKDI